MPLFRHEGFPEDWTYLYDQNPDPEQYVEVPEPTDKPTKKSAKTEETT